LKALRLRQPSHDSAIIRSNAAYQRMHPPLIIADWHRLCLHPHLDIYGVTASRLLSVPGN